MSNSNNESQIRVDALRIKKRYEELWARAPADVLADALENIESYDITCILSHLETGCIEHCKTPGCDFISGVLFGLGNGPNSEENEPPSVAAHECTVDCDCHDAPGCTCYPGGPHEGCDEFDGGPEVDENCPFHGGR